MQELLRVVESKSMKDRVPDCRVGDTVRVMVRISEVTEKKEERHRLQAFEGVVIARTGGGIDESIKVRRVTHGFGIERIFPLHAPVVDDVIIVRHGKVRRSKLYYLRDRTGKAARVRQQARDVVLAREETARKRAQAEAAAQIEAAEAESAQEMAEVPEQPDAAPEEASPEE